MMYAVEMDLGAILYIPNFVEICSVIQKLTGGYTGTQREW
jgi:hypothetical protein